jgi:hypothetical protein
MQKAGPQALGLSITIRSDRIDYPLGEAGAEIQPSGGAVAGAGERLRFLRKKNPPGCRRAI